MSLLKDFMCFGFGEIIELDKTEGKDNQFPVLPHSLNLEIYRTYV